MHKGFKIFLKVLFFLLFFAFAGGLIFLGLHYSDLTRKQHAYEVVIDALFDKAESIASLNSDYLFGDSFEVEGTVKMELSSEEYASKALTDPEYVKKNRMLKNLSAMNTTFLLQHDVKNNKAYGKLDEKIGEETIFSGKYLITNSTDYYFVEKVLSNYVNDGGNNYFESFSEEAGTIENISYLYHFIRDSFKTNIKEDDLEGDTVETLVGDNTVKVSRVAYRINDDQYKSLMKAVLKDLKNDSRSNQILSLIDPNFKDYKFNEKKRYLAKNETYTIFIYLAQWTYKPVKIEVLHVEGDEQESYTYDGDLNKGLFYYSLNNEMKYRATYEGTSKKMDIMVYDHMDREIGTIKGQKDKDNLMLTMTLELEKKKYDITYSAKNKDLTKNDYNREINVTFKFMDDKITTLNGNILVNAKVSGSTKIDEDTSSSVLESTLSEEEKTKIENLRDTIKERLEK